MCTGTLSSCNLCQCEMCRLIIVQHSMTVWFVQCHYCTALFDRAVCTGSLFYCSRCQFGISRITILLQSVSAVWRMSSLYCTLRQCDMYRVFIALHSVSGRWVQGRYGFAVMCKCCIYRVIHFSLCLGVMYSGLIFLQSLSVLYVRGHYCTEVGVLAVCTESLFYWILCQCSMYWGIINLLPTKAPHPFQAPSDERNEKFKYPVHSCGGLAL